MVISRFLVTWVLDCWDLGIASIGLNSPSLIFACLASAITRMTAWQARIAPAGSANSREVPLTFSSAAKTSSGLPRFTWERNRDKAPQTLRIAVVLPLTVIVNSRMPARGILG